jgi:type II secretory pathway pseudopilin PulG
MKGLIRFQSARNTRAFTWIELLLVVVVLGMLLALHLPFYARLRERTHITIDHNNIRQILQASALYSSENDERLAHPTWGSDLTGPDGWAYLTSKAGRVVPGAIANTPGSCAGRDTNSTQFTNQLAFFKVGQVTQYLPDVRTAWCPKDVATRGSGRLRSLWIGRPVKVTSYSWNATIGGYVGPYSQNLNGRTYKVSQFLPTDWQMWDQNENDSFNFNDAASHPETPIEGVSLRHTGATAWYTFTAGSPRNLAGGGMIGTFGGAARYVRWSRVYDLMNRKVPAPNELLNGPGYR